MFDRSLHDRKPSFLEIFIINAAMAIATVATVWWLTL